MTGEATGQNAGGSMIADETIAEVLKPEIQFTCSMCTKTAVEQIVNNVTGDSMIFCEDHSSMIWVLLEGLGLSGGCEVVKL